MSKDIIVLAPNGRRQKVHCTADTLILKILEDVCEKQGFQATEYDLKHHNHILDLTATLRFTNLPNKATLEMVEAERKREETNVTIGLLLEDGERRTADFPPNTSLYDLVVLLAPQEFKAFEHPTIMYMRQEVTGVPALQEKTLRQLGLLRGRAILRLLNKSEEAKQANVSSVYRCPTSKPTDDTFMPGPSNINKTTDTVDPVALIKKAKKGPSESSPALKEEVMKEEPATSQAYKVEKKESPMEIDQSEPVNTVVPATQESLERRLRIEEEVTFLGAHKAVAFMQSDNMEEEMEDLPDDFYELTIEEVRKLYKDLQQHRLELENTPLLTSNKREDLAIQSSRQKMAGYKNVVVRVQFPDHMILQGIFSPTDCIGDVNNFIKNHLHNPDKPFHIFTTPLKEPLDPKMTLLEAKFVPCVHMHFKWLQEDGAAPYLKEEVYLKQTSCDAAGILASKYRAPCRRKAEDVPGNSQKSNAGPSSATKSSKVLSWFK